MARKTLGFINGFITFALAVCFLTIALYAGFALWDNQRIYDNADTVFDEMKEIKNRMVLQAQSAASQSSQTKTDLTPVEVSEADDHLETHIENSGSEAISQSAPVLGETQQTSSVNQEGMVPEAVIPAGQNVSVVAFSDTQPATVTVRTSDNSEITVEANHIQGTIVQQQAMPETESSLAEETEAAVQEESYEAYGAPFDELVAINKDVNGWLTMDNTAIDYPLVQGQTNFDYLNQDVYGNFALSGSIYLDSRNNNKYTDVYSLLYGHNMSRSRMFGDVILYKDKAFFEKNQTGEIYLRDRMHKLQSISCVICSASDGTYFDPECWNRMNAEEILFFVQEQAVMTNEVGLATLKEKLDAGEQPHILALSTCSGEFTDARTILLTLMDP